MSIPRVKDSQHLTKSSPDPFFRDKGRLIGDAERLQDLVLGYIILHENQYCYMDGFPIYCKVAT